MSGKRTFQTAVLILVLGVGVHTVARAAPPWAKLLASDRVEADPNKEYPVTEQSGPWMIMAASFSGEGAQKQAHDLVLELRKRYKLAAYSHKLEFKLDDANGLATKRPSIGYRWQYKQLKEHPELRQEGALDEFSVLVGDYPAIDDPAARKDLQTIKYVEPDCLTAQGKPTYQTLAALRHIQEDIKERLSPGTTESKRRGPMGHAFITTNPLLPSDYYAPKGTIDKLVLRMNEGVTHSLLDCPGKYTVQVAQFTGVMVTNQQRIQEIEKGGKLPSMLTKAAEQAHTLTEELRKLGYHAYEFHDRYASIVTVGSFDSVGTPLPNGKVEINPQIHRIMETFGAQPVVAGGQPVGAIRAKIVAGVPLDVQPIPVEVPKRSISRALAQRLDSDRR
ncbi:MAG: hypothetical protein ABR915_18670 [Thermoguttaceae bacterium]|jgi:hypothetical protein